MILHPGVLALYTGSAITLLLLAVAAYVGIRILLKWDIQSSSEEQLLLERRTYLVSTVVLYGLVFEMFSFFLFIYTADDLHNLLVGAMCATGSLNANVYGFPALYARLATLFLAFSWVALNRTDIRAEDYPLVKVKYALLLLLIPVVLAADILQLLYFTNIDPNVITSCCGSLFSEGGSGLSSSIASLPVRQTRYAFFALYLLTMLAGLAAIKGKTAALMPYALLSFLFLIVSVVSIISFICLYFYQMPSHHCPFDILQANYYYVGYPLYMALFTGGSFGIMAGVTGLFRNVRSLKEILPGIRRRWVFISAAAFTLFFLISVFPMLFGSFRMEA